MTRQGKGADKRERIERLARDVRRMSAQGVLMSHVVAERVGMHASDLECMDLVVLGEAESAGDLARATGLTTGAITAVIDRLEKAGYVRREPDPADRRRVLVRVMPERLAALDAIYAPLQSSVMALWSTFSEAELDTVLRFISKSIEVSRRFTEEVRSGAAAAPKPTPARSRRDPRTKP